MADEQASGKHGADRNGDAGAPVRLTVAEQVQAMAMAQIEGELAALAAARAQAAERPRAPRKQRGHSVVYSLRLDVDQITALERRAALLGVPPTALARNLIRIGLADSARPTVAGAVDQLETTLSGLRALASEAATAAH